VENDPNEKEEETNTDLQVITIINNSLTKVAELTTSSKKSNISTMKIIARKRYKSSRNPLLITSFLHLLSHWPCIIVFQNPIKTNVRSKWKMFKTIKDSRIGYNYKTRCWKKKKKRKNTKSKGTYFKILFAAN
jgi:hypothetical protein